jgi:uncharacterized membrane protein
MNNFLTGLLYLLYALITIAIYSLILGLPVMLLWNWIIPALFGLTKITFWQAIGLNLLCGLLFKGTNTIYNNKQ